MGFAIAAQWPWASSLFPVRVDVTALVVVTVLYVVVERFTIMFPVRRGVHTITLSEIPLVLGLLLIPPPLHLLARVVGAAVGLTVFRRQRGSRLAFNLALYAVQVTVASAIFALLTRAGDPMGPVGWLATFAASFAADVVSIVLVTAAIALHDDPREWRSLVSADLKGLFQLPIVAVTTSLALVTFLLVRQEVAAAALLGVIAFAAYRVFHRYAQQTRGHEQVEELYEFTQALAGSRDSDAVTRVVLSRVRDLVRAEVAEIVVPGDDVASIRIRMSGVEDVEVGTEVANRAAWWQPAAVGEPVLRPAAARRDAGPTISVDGMAVPVALDSGAGVLIVTGCMPDITSFTHDHLRLMQALANHAGVALTNVQLLERLSHVALHDVLTGLPNRRGFHDEVEAALAADRPVAVLLIDLDRFQEVNDALGYDMGDDLLREVGDRLRDEMHGRGTVARIGGDEFAVLVPDAGGREAVLAIANDLRRAVELPVPVGSLSLSTQASVGICVGERHDGGADRLLQRADAAMNLAKDTGSGVRIYSPEDDQDTGRRLLLMTALRDAIHGDSLEVVYQPKVDPRSGVVLGAEALCRWRYDGAPVSPDEFIPLAERSGIIHRLTLQVLETALHDCAAWRRAGHHLSVAVNLSPRILTDETLVDAVRHALKLTGMPGTALTLEITENAVMNDPANSIRTLHALRSLGVALSIDDFGTGHSSLGRLAALPISEVKIDKSFVRHLTTDRNRRAVTDASLQLGHALELVVVAEGVEDAAEYEYLRQNGCDAIQGYYVSRPLRSRDFAAWLDERHMHLSRGVRQGR